MSPSRHANILYIHSHDTGRYIGPYGRGVDTPVLQGLAQEGVMFRSAWSGAPTCSPSRACLLTGQSAHGSGMLGLAHRGFSLSDPRRHLVHTLKAQGYLTALAGIQHEAAAAWPEDPFEMQPHAAAAREPATELLGYDRYLGPAPVAHTAAASFLRNPPARPFFLSVGFFETHREFPALADDGEARFVRPPDPLPDLPEVRIDMARFLRSARALDQKVGHVLQALRTGGAADSTLVIATTDHGIAFPRMKCSLTDDGIGVYLIMRGPGGFSGGRVIDAMVSHLDLFPTICDWAGLAPPPWLEGQSLLPLVRDARAQVRDRVFAEVNYHAAYEPMRCVRTTRFKYIARYDGRTRPVLPNVDDGESKTALRGRGWFPIEAEQLFDLAFDPHETRNLVADAAYSETLAELRESLAGWMRRTSDPLGNAAPGEAPARIPAPPGAHANSVDGVSPGEPTQTL